MLALLELLDQQLALDLGAIRLAQFRGERAEDQSGPDQFVEIH